MEFVGAIPDAVKEELNQTETYELIKEKCTCKEDMSKCKAEKHKCICKQRGDCKSRKHKCCPLW